MQPLYTVDHESRHNSSHADEERQHQPATTTLAEDTPLLQHFPDHVHSRTPATTLIVSLLLIILLAGIVIGIYLLVLQNDSENVLPPVEMPLQLVSRSQWDYSDRSQIPQKLFPYRLKQVMVVQTNTNQCSSTETCMKLLQEMQANATAANDTIPYNFLISSNGQTYEALGWHESSPISTQQPSKGIVLALIGNFSQILPTKSQMQEVKNFFALCISQQHLHPSYRIVGKTVNDTPEYISKSFESFPQWDSKW